MTRRSFSIEWPDACGVIKQVGISQSGLLVGSGSGSVASMPAQAIVPWRKATASAS
jgi:hypothetical protein